MLRLELYIHGAAFIAPETAIPAETLRLTAEEPDYTAIIQPMQLRRLSKVVRMSIGAANACLRSAGIAIPDAIAIGTTMGCLQDTEVFLKKIVTQDEQMLTPTSFIQSTHNTIGGQIALLSGCNGYNTTISQHGHSFEGALMATALYLAENDEVNMLCGGADELTDTSFQLMQRTGAYASALPQQTGAIGGEGAGCLLLNKRPEGTKACIKGMLLFTEKNADAALTRINEYLQAAGGRAFAEGLWLGDTGDVDNAAVYRSLIDSPGKPPVLFKQQSGEWGTVIATAIARAVLEWPVGQNRIWLVNHYCEDWSIVLLART